ncbi:LysR family transcriptional regulator [Sporosarcina sp. ACRSL]|uniref:LysR family transcriptional regulator n=1 Tax=Sporosarcina sp. ACRSL TaxID=2918215 RepID=UPI001EF6BDAF|nr:LysR family transcriptional regulator [Sporosarcina sp. ACRSL]MCG7344954.1 LysR family transcriptional regulator [Sporosarcina sp. ACRSL]
MNLNDCKLLADLRITRNITHTAANLYISQPALTYRIQQLEKKYGVPLIVRGSKGIEFTEEGRILHEHALTMLQNEELIMERLARASGEISGTIKIGASRLFSHYKLPRILNAFNNMYPNIDIHLKTGWSRDIKEALTLEQIHVAIIRGNYTINAESHLLNKEELYVVSKTLFTKEDVPNLQLITYETDLSLSQMIDKWWRTNFDAPIKPSIETDQAATCKEMVKYGMGIAVLPAISIEGEELFKISLNEFGDERYFRETKLYYNKYVQDLRHVNLFLDFMRDWYPTKVNV